MDFNAKSSTLRHKQTPEVLPASQYLQDRLQERRARNSRPKRTRQSDFGPRMTTGQDDDLFFAEAEDGRRALERSYDSSPLAPIPRYAGDNVNSSNGSSTLSAGGRKRRMPGARELDEQMDRLTKQNFDLKLELDHRRESQAKLHAEIEAMKATVLRAERLEEEHEELMRINSLLVEELEKRDKAIQEAADIICELEEKIEDYDEARPGTAQADSGYAGTENQEHMVLSSPPQVASVPVVSRRPSAGATVASTKLNSAVRANTPSRSRREPAFLTSQQPSTTALRSVFLNAGKDIHPVKSFNSILSRHASTIDENVLAEEVLNSPRLSALSESSFPSIYGKKSETPEKYDWEDMPEGGAPFGSAHSRQDSISRVNQWIEDRQTMVQTPSKSSNISSPVLTANMMPMPQLRRSAENSIQSLSSAAASARSNLLEAPAPIRPFRVPGTGVDHAPRSPVTATMSSFEEGLLPPTPVSVSTQMPRASQSSVVGRHKPLHQSSAINTASAHDVLEDDDGDTDEEYYEARSYTLRDGLEYDGYPDGNSITKGTPSRFLQHGKQHSTASDMFFNSSDLSPHDAMRAAQRRKSSSEVTSTPYRKPMFHRSETSPNAYGFNGRQTNPRPATSGSNFSPRSYDSAFSSIRTTPQNRYSRSMSPEVSPYYPDQTPTSTSTQHSPPKFRRQPSSGQTVATRSSFSQKTHNLFRRLSNTTSTQNGDEPRGTPRRDREISPLPTLTSTPSSAYQMQSHREIRRPNTSASMRPKQVRSASRDASAHRPALSPRTMTDPNFSPGESGGSSGQAEPPMPALKRGLFRRTGSVKQADVSSVRSLRR